MAQAINRRKSARYQPEVPIEIELEIGKNFNISKECLNNISIDGLSFRFDFLIPKGRLININIPMRRTIFAMKGEVVWCEQKSGAYDIGIKFSEASDVFKAKIYSQICRIEDYRQEVFEKEGRQLSFNEAAKEWISKFAGDFSLLSGQETMS
ncbi:MAG: PilZ domain-containing protein [Elusimicrobiota bacterium]